jgi:hypothetical protein
MFGKLFGKSLNKKGPKSGVAQPPGIKPFAGQKVEAPDLELLEGPQKTPAEPSAPGGFDPYNTGTFDKRKTWGRVTRR